MCTANMGWLMIAKVQFHSIMGLDLCFELINGIIVHLFDMHRLLMRYLGNFCHFSAVMRLI